MDVLIAGGGPAGSVAALVLARAGVRVRVVDRASFPRDKLCGDTINPGALALLDRLGLGAEVRARGFRTRGMQVTGPGGAVVPGVYEAPFSGAALSRRVFDQILLSAAAEAGAVIDERRRVAHPLVEQGRVVGLRLTSGGRTEAVRAPLVIAADGRPSTIAFALGLARFAPAPQRWAYGAYYAGVQALSAFGEMHVRRGHYLGIAPLPDGLANVCVVRAWRRGVVPPVSGDILQQTIARDDTVAGRFDRAERVGPVMVLGPLAVDAQAAGMPGLLLAGDAAGFIDPITGDGIRFALRGAELAAQAALESLASGLPTHEALARRRTREFGGKWRFNRALRTLTAMPAAVSVAAAVSARWGGPVRPLIAMAGDLRYARAEQRILQDVCAEAGALGLR